MNKLRTWIAITLAWFFVFLNIERFHEPINISSFVYVLAMGLSLCMVTFPPVHDRTVGAIVAVALTIFVALKFMLGYQVVGQMLPITITEGGAIIVSMMVSHRVAWSIRDFEFTVSDLDKLGRLEEGLDFKLLQEDIYREVRRARNFDRPLSIVTIDVPLKVDKESLDQLIAEVHRKTKVKYLQARLLELIATELNDSDILSIRDGKFVLVLTETNRELAEEVAIRVRERIEEFLGCEAKAGIASFPDEEITMSGLLTRSESGLKFDGMPQVAETNQVI